MGNASVGGLLDDRRQIVLSREDSAHPFVGRHDAGSNQRPVVIGAAVEQGVEVDRLVGAMKIPDAEMENARRELGTFVRRLSHVVGKGGERGE